MARILMPRSRCKAALPIAAGLVVAQVIALIVVQHSNQVVARTAQAMTAAGWLAIPAGSAATDLPSFQAAFGGALFFTLSAGAALTLTSWAAVHLLIFAGRWRHWLIRVMIVCWAVLLGVVNLKGPALFPSALVFFVPLATVWVCLPRRFAIGPATSSLAWIVPVLVLVLLTGLWATQAKNDLFITIRDRLLLSNAIGSKVNDFYYRHTLCAAEVFKSFNQKTLRSCRLENFNDPALQRRLATRLAALDILTVGQHSAVDLTLVQTGKRLQLISANHQATETDLATFLADPAPWLNKVSNLGDHHAPLRRLTFLGLLLGFPILLYLAWYGLIRWMAGRFWGDPKAAWVASGFCLLVGLVLFIPMLSARPANMDPQALDATWTADHWTQRVAALRHLEGKGLEIGRYPGYRQLLDSPLVVERYWLARALAVSRSADTYADLLAMINDPHPNVVCQAYYALGQRGRPVAVGAIKTRILQSGHWYTQWYGYRAIRKLGWRQTLSN